MRAIDLDTHMRHLGTWVDWTNTVDTFKAGDPHTEVRIVNHATAEEWGMRSLAPYIRKHFPDTPVHHLPQGCQYVAALPSS